MRRPWRTSCRGQHRRAGGKCRPASTQQRCSLPLSGWPFVIQHNVALRESCLTRPTLNTLCRRRLSEGRVAVFFRIGVRLAAGVVLLRTARRTGLRPLLSASRPFFGFHGVAALPGGAGSVPTLGQRQPQSRSRSFVTALNGFTSPRPNPLHWLRPARSCRLLTRSRARHLRSVLPPPGASLPRRCPAGLASPRPADASPSHRQAAERLAPR